MTPLTLLLELLRAMNNLLSIGMTSDHLYQARMHIDYLFTTFNESDHNERTTLEDTEGIVTHIAHQLAHLPEDVTLVQVHFIMEFITILQRLLGKGMTMKQSYLAHDSLDELLKAYEELAEAEEDKLRAELNNRTTHLEDIPIHITTFFYDLTAHLCTS